MTGVEIRLLSPTNQSCDLWTLVLLWCPAPTEASRGRSVAPLSLRQRSWTTAGLVCIFHDKNMLWTCCKFNCKSQQVEWSPCCSDDHHSVLFLFSGISDDAVLWKQAGQKGFLWKVGPLPCLLQEQWGWHVSRLFTFPQSPSFPSPLSCLL